MRATLLFFPALLLHVSSATAHSGHIETVAGHNHWVAAAAVGAAIAISAWAVLKNRKKPDPKTDAADDRARDT